ncbi:MAG: PHB depolymerase family esterase [Steroidobacteraceae bacterium]
MKISTPRLLVAHSAAATSLTLMILLGIQTATAAPRATPLESHSLLSGGEERRYWVHQPPQPAPGGGIVFVLHGSNGDGPGMRELLGQRLEALTDRAGFFVVYPDGFERHWNDCRALASYAANQHDVDDPAFLRAIVAAMVRRSGIDERRTFAIGYSNGGHMVLRLALEDAGSYAGLAVVAANLPAPAGRDCETRSGATPIALFAGTADTINPYRGGIVRVGDDVSRGHVLAAEYTASWLARRAGHVGGPVSQQYADRDHTDRSRAERLAWIEPGKPPVWLYILHGAGHTIPGSPDRSPDSPSVTNRDIDAAAQSWRLFQSVDPGFATR